MRVGVVFPQTEIGNDPLAIRDCAQATEELGYTHVLVFEHVLGAHPERAGGWSGPYTHEHPFHEPFVLLGYLAGFTKRLELVTGVVVLPQRQTALVAKQAAEVDVLSGGRLRLGIGVGWNPVEYEALGQDFRNRGLRVEEQVGMLRALWTEEVVDFEGRWHRVSRAGINPLPVQRPIPLWMGGMAEPVLRRVARLADGWFPQFQPGDRARQMLERLRGYLQEAGRPADAVGVEGRIRAGPGGPPAWAEAARAWRELGATHLAFNTMNVGLSSPGAHIEAIRRFREALSGPGPD